MKLRQTIGKCYVEHISHTIRIVEGKKSEKESNFFLD